MKNFGINQVGIQKYQKGTPKGGVQQSSTWTSEYISPFGNKKVRPIKEQEELIIKSRQREGAKRFDKGFRTLWGIARLHPTTALGTDIVDALVAGKNRDFNEYALNAYAGGARGYKALGDNTTIKPKDQYKYNYKRSRAILGKGLSYGLGTILAIPDMIDDTIDLYNTVTE